MNKPSATWQPNTLEDQLVKLVPLNENHFEDLYKVASDPLIWEQHPASDRYKRDVFKVFFENAIKSAGAFLITDKKTGEVMGSTRFYDYKQNDSCVCIGFTFLARKYWGGVYNKSVKKLTIDYAFKHVNTVVFHVGSNNTRSQIAISRFGAIKSREFTTENYGKTALSFEYLLEKKNWLH